MKFVYSDKYLNYHFETGHPFWSERAKVFLNLLENKNFDYEIVDANRAKKEDILLVHTSKYLERVRKLAKKKGSLSWGTQVNPDNLEASYYYVGGTIKAAKIALKEGLAVNILGGLHHAEANDSSGFCIFNDHAIAIRKMQKEKEIETTAVLDIDVHAGNGTQEIFYENPDVLTISIHQDPTNFYPGTGFKTQKGKGEGKGFNLNYPLPAGTTEEEYLPVLDEAIEQVKKYEPDILFIVFGADTYREDPLAGFGLELSTYKKIAQRLKKLRIEEAKDVPQVVLFAGGYSREVPEIWWEFIQGLD